MLSARVVDASPSFGKEKLEEFRRGYATGAVLLAAIVPLGITAAAELVTWYADAQAELSPLRVWGFGLSWLFAALAVPLLWLTKRALGGASERPPGVYWVQSGVQLLWLTLLVWSSTPLFLPVIFFILCVLLFNDSRYFYADGTLKALYLSVWLAQLVLLLGVDAVGGPGLLHALRVAPSATGILLLTEACVAALSFAIIEVVGRGHRATDEAGQHARELEAKLAAIQAQRGVLSRSCDFLIRGLSAGRFSHDVSSPISILDFEVERLEGLMRARGPLSADEEECLRRISKASEVAARLARSLARSLRESVELQQHSLVDFVQDSLREAELGLQRHAIALKHPKLSLEPLQVVVTSDHAAAVAGVIVNGVLQNPAEPLEISASLASDHFCKLSVRDHGVLPDVRLATINRVEAHMSLQGDETNLTRASEYDGYGIGLLLTKALVVRWGGWLAVTEPSRGRGVQFDFVLPAVFPDQIPPELDFPERMLQKA